MQKMAQIIGEVGNLSELKPTSSGVKRKAGHLEDDDDLRDMMDKARKRMKENNNNLPLQSSDLNVVSSVPARGISISLLKWFHCLRLYPHRLLTIRPSTKPPLSCTKHSLTSCVATLSLGLPPASHSKVVTRLWQNKMLTR